MHIFGAGPRRKPKTNRRLVEAQQANYKGRETESIPRHIATTIIIVYSTEHVAEHVERNFCTDRARVRELWQCTLQQLWVRIEFALLLCVHCLHTWNRRGYAVCGIVAASAAVRQVSGQYAQFSAAGSAAHCDCYQPWSFSVYMYMLPCW